MATLQSPLVQILLWLVAAAATFWILGPGVMYLRRKNRFWMVMSDNPADAEPDGRDRKYAERFRQFAALGFRPAGRTVEHARFMTPMHWSWTSHGTKFLASPDGKTFVGNHRIAGGNPLRTTAYSTFEQGGLIMTASPGVPSNVDAGANYKHEAVGETTPDELLGIHSRRVAAFVRERGLTVKQATMREIGAEIDAYSRIVLPKMKLGAHGSSIVGMFLIPVVMTLAMSFVRGTSSRSLLPIVICACAALYALVRWAILPSRIPMMVRMAVMGAVILLPSLALIRFVSPERIVERSLARLDADASIDPARAVDRITRHGVFACKPLVRHLDSPAIKPQTRAVIHQALVKLHGSDLGETPSAWQGWCVEVTRR